MVENTLGMKVDGNVGKSVLTILAEFIFTYFGEITKGFLKKAPLKKTIT